MRLIENTGTNRVIDVLRESSQPGCSIDIASPAMALFAYAVLRDVLDKANGSRLITCPSGRLIDGPPPGTYWRVSKPKFDELDRDGRIWWGADGDNMPRLKRFLSDVKEGRVPQTLWTYEEVGHTQEAKKELISLVEFPNSDVVFDTPKPTRLIRRILQLTTGAGKKDSNSEVQPQELDRAVVEPEIVLDFFAGTGSTLDAMFRQNAEDHVLRRGILVQLPEPMGNSGGELKTIADVTKARLRSAGRKVREGAPMFAGDLGFRVFKLDTSNIRTWDPDRTDLGQSLLDSLDHLQAGRTEQDILYELLLKLGLDLCVPTETRTIAGKVVHAIGGGVLMACLAASISREDVESLAHGIVEWHEALQPAGEVSCVFRDSAFADDVAKTNLAAILAQRGIENVRSL
jgi:adenine-specific DNA-methyltransferase